MRPAAVLATLVALVVACAPPTPRDEAPAEGNRPAAAGPRCTPSTNTVDEGACPTLRAARCEAGPMAQTQELCRRLYLDLVGALPSPAEVDGVCAGRDARAIATTLMATPAYVRQQQELWGEVLAYDPTQIHGKWLADADRIVAALVTGEMRYDDFAKAILGHPVFGVGARLPRSDLEKDEDRYFPQVARLALSVFLGRTPFPGEDASLGQLFRPWRKRNVILNVDYGRTDPFLQPLACPCQSSAFGVTTTITLPGGAIDYDDAKDQPEIRRELDKVGALFVAQPSFWMQGVDLALRMMLGWWKSTRNQDESFLPEMQAALAMRFERAPSWRDLVLEIVSSELYRRSNRLPEGTPTDLPVYCSGPLRVVRPEAYVSSLGKLLSVRVGRCDHRTNERKGRFYPDGSEGTFFPDGLRNDEESDAALLGITDYHYMAARGMGGCTAGASRSEEPTLPLVFGAAPVAREICSASPVVASVVAGAAKSEATVRSAADRLSRLLRGREPSAAEREAIARDAAACVADPACDAKTLAVEMCAAFARSMDAITY